MTVNTYKHSHTLTETLVYIVYTSSVNCKYKAFRRRQKSSVACIDELDNGRRVRVAVACRAEVFEIWRTVRVSVSYTILVYSANFSSSSEQPTRTKRWLKLVSHTPTAKYSTLLAQYIASFYFSFSVFLGILAEIKVIKVKLRMS